MKVIHGIVKMPYPNKPYIVIASEASDESQTSTCGEFDTLPEANERLTETLYHGEGTPPFLNQARQLKWFVIKFIDASKALGMTESELYETAVELMEKPEMDFR